MNTWNCCEGTPPIHCPLSSSVWLCLSCILYNNKIMISKALSWVSWIMLANYQTRKKGQVVGTLYFIVCKTEVWIMRSQYVWLAYEVRAILWDWDFDLEPLTSRELVSELNCRTPSWCQNCLVSGGRKPKLHSLHVANQDLNSGLLTVLPTCSTLHMRRTLPQLS